MRLFFYFPVFLLVFTAIGYFFPTGLSAQTPDRAPLDPVEGPTAEVIPEPAPRPAKPTRSHGEVIDPGVNGDITTDGDVTVHGDANGDIEAEKVKVYGTADNYDPEED